MEERKQVKTIPTELTPLRNALLELHRELLEYERRKFETEHGSMGSSGNVLAIIMNHPAFSWLRKLSGLIVAIDVMLDPTEKSPVERTAKEVALDTEKLLAPNEEGDEFSQKYHEALLDEPKAAIAHGQVLNELKKIL